MRSGALPPEPDRERGVHAGGTLKRERRAARNDFYVITASNFDNFDLKAEVDESQVTWERVFCEGRGEVRGRRTSPLAVVPPRRFRDFAWTFYGDLFATENARAEVLQEGITGVEFEPVVLSGGKPGPLLWEVRVTGFAGFARLTDGIRVREAYEDCGLYGFDVVSSLEELFDVTKWDGTDLFVMWPFPRIILATRRFVNLLRRSNAIDMECVPLARWRRVGSTALPGLPARWLSEEMIRRLYADPDFFELIHEQWESR